MENKPVIWVAAAVVVAGLGTAYYFHTRHAAPVSAPVAAQPPPAAPEEPAIQHPIPGSAAAAPLPPLNDSDRTIKEALGALLGANAPQYLVPEDIVRHIVVTVDNLPRQKLAVTKRPVVPLSGAFLVQGDDQGEEVHATLDPKNFARYDSMVKVVRQLDMQRVADLYFRFYPLFQGAYQDLGYPTGYFNDRLVQAIDSLLATPQVAGPIELARPNVMYLFADPTLEARPAGQKILLRMGPDNAAAIKAKLTELRAIITAAPPER
jgi:Protein of unknown function (DUF3014)